MGLHDIYLCANSTINVNTGPIFSLIPRLRRTTYSLIGMPKLIFLDEPPEGDNTTEYDREHAALYLRLLDAEAQRANWREVVKVIFGLDPTADFARARRVYDNHLARARLIAASGHRDLLAPKGKPAR